MKFLKAIDKVLAGFGNIRAMERNHVDTFTEDLITNIKGQKIAESEYGQLFVSHQHLNGYNFLNASILSGSNIKTFKGCAIVFESGDSKISISSDTKDIESDFSNVSNRWLTKVSFIIDESQKTMISNKDFDNVFINYKKKSLPMARSH